ncbi:MAG: hypothetical protein HYW50_00535 [Candidatus Diapherotrites archaeon]|nr:hypothetical protein [Candidatus Diapherotrites archaeon]
MKTIVFKVSYSGGKKFERTFEFNETQTLVDLHDTIMKEHWQQGLLEDSKSNTRMH